MVLSAVPWNCFFVVFTVRTNSRAHQSGIVGRNNRVALSQRKKWPTGSVRLHQKLGHFFSRFRGWGTVGYNVVLYRVVDPGGAALVAYPLPWRQGLCLGILL